MKGSDYLLWADALKIISIFAVVVIHSAAPLLIQYHELGAAQWWVGNFYDSCARWAIPIFIMVSGAFLIDKAANNSLTHFFLRRFQRVFVPFVIWSLIYFLWRIHVNKEDLALPSFFTLIFMEPIYYHLWFLYILIGLYLLAPILSIYLRNAQRKNILYFLSLWVVLGSVLPMIEGYLSIETYLSTGASNSIFKYVGYFILGYFLRDVRLGSRGITLFAFVFFLGFFITACGTYYLTVVQNSGRFNGLLYEYFSVNVLMMALSVYLLGKSITFPICLQQCEVRFRIFSLLAACVPGIYLAHALLIAVAKRGMLGATFSNDLFHPALGIPFFAIVIFLVSFVLVLIIKNIPVVKYIVP